MSSDSRLRFAAARLLALVLVALPAGSATALLIDAPSFSEEAEIRAAGLSPAAEQRAEAMARVAAGYLAVDSDPDDSMRHYLRALELDLSNAPLAQHVAAHHLQRGEVPEALAVLKDALKRNPESASLALRIAGIYVVSLRKFEPAERYARMALDSAPDLIEPYQMLYSIRRANGRAGDAEKLLGQAARRGNGDPMFWAGLGDLWVRQLLMDGRLRDPEAAAPAVEHYRRAASLGQQDAAVLLRALNFFFAGGHLEDAVACGRRLLVLQPSDALSREKVALSLASLGREDEAILELDAVINDNPASLLAYRAHGEILLQRNDIQGALDKFEKALLLSDDDPRLYLEIVDLCVKNENAERAVWWLSQARTKFDRLPELPYYEGQLLGHLKRWREALNAFNQAAELAGQYQPVLLTADFHFQHGVMAERAGEFAEAEKHFRACLAVDDSNAAALNYLGYMWAERGENLGESEMFIRRALEIEPENAAYLDSLGWVLYQQGRYHEALDPLQRASKLSAADPDATIEEHLGDVLDKLGRRGDAVKAWERAAALDGASDDVGAKLQAARGSGVTDTAAETKSGRP